VTEKHGRRRVVIERVYPEIDEGRFPVKRVVGEPVVVEADVFADGHDELACVLRHRPAGQRAWRETPMSERVNDRWQGRFTVETLEDHRFTLVAWVDRFATWRRDLATKADAGLEVGSELLAGAALLEQHAARARGRDHRALAQAAAGLRDESPAQADRIAAALDESLAELVGRHPDRSQATAYPRQVTVRVDRPKARFSTWYEMFPRSASAEPGRHGTFRDCIARLPYIAEMGFDVLYFPPIHPIAHTRRKGANNAPTAGPGDPGSPWAIGAAEGGHKAIHPALGDFEDFEALRAAAADYGIELALDIALQCSPEHPWVREHPEWFHHRPDGTIQYAENPPKKYEDIYPLAFDTEAWWELWQELKSVFEFWIERGVRIFRVDNPHTKPFAFWEWLIDELRAGHPDVLFLSEAFTRPKRRYRLAKLGFQQSYSYFAWRNEAWELQAYLTELTRTEVHEFFRPNLWPNTPDILHEYLQTGGRPAFMTRLILAATLSGNYGIYGPPFELMESTPRSPGSEEYLDSEKYQLRCWDIESDDSLRDFIALVNRIRREHPALQRTEGLAFQPCSNDRILAYTKEGASGADRLLLVVNVDPHGIQGGTVELPLADWAISPQEPFEVHELLTDERYTWRGPHNYVELNPHVVPAHILHVTKHLRRAKESS